MALVVSRRALACAASLAALAPVLTAQSPPNVIVFLADDLGYGDVGPYDHDENPLTPDVTNTPVLDKLATEGVVMTDFYADAPICSPTRAALLTGRHAMRQGMTAPLGPAAPTLGMSQSEVTLAEILKPLGYRTGIVGKWHLGQELQFNPLYQGFDFFWGAPFSNSSPTFYLMWNLTVIDPDPDQDYLTQNYTTQARAFIASAVEQQQPFFLYFAYTAVHVPVHASPAFQGITGRGIYADAVYEMDWSVGEVLRDLELLGIEQDTLVLFTSDNGACDVSHTPGKPANWACGSNKPLKGYKGMLTEGGIRAHFVARWPGVIPAGTTTSEPGGVVDIMPTVAAATGAELPPDREIDGWDLTPMWTVGAARPAFKELHFYRTYGGAQYGQQSLAWTRSGPWKQGYDTSLVPTELYDLSQDPGETTPLVDPVLTATLADRSRSYDCALWDPFALPPPGNLARGKPTWASSSEDCRTSSEAVAGTPAKWRSSGAADEWLMVDLEQAAFLPSVQLYWGGLPATQYDVEVSDDGSAWATAYSETAGDGGLDDIPLGVVSRFLRVHATAGPGPAFTLRELVLLAPPAASKPAIK